ncbi:hypothetical protein CC1G_05122 [Coprinopsis cinerea okayama7|uniref:Meiotically up-regulated protein Msb1/Mug8 domain-containing protein n=1 Tax=Coprinopsis cinerea (strain Okayama-7 / 130 / ATCC MYA-4618 / FGSC 9003) TaxID=240176 RepID=A8NFX7_COPC7|nr:hypothetical protein CC1G_05122 [Coprinopsis cinerea okayama7\|eukprot:XP_001833422.2 hypothetical protein CC1G_05122 [Coprinopsis cinerea okayama7\
MPSFLSKVLRRKRDDREGSSASKRSEPEAKGARREDDSPSTPNFPDDNGQQRGRGREATKDKDRALRTFFRSKSRAPSPSERKRKSEDAPVSFLSLDLLNDAGSEPTAVLDDSAVLLSNKALGDRKLTPVEAAGLVRTCSQAITLRGVDTLGIMHPHWYSASQDIQRRLISLFIHSLSTQTPSSVPSFESEISTTHSPHDVAAVLRWGLRHLQLEGGSFGKEKEWYNTFFDSERNAEYPPKAFSEKLAPLVPASNYDLLKEVFEIFSSLASHAETNSTSGGKLSKMFGLWLLSTNRVEPKDDWKSFYERWEHSGRQLEHLFLASIRDQAAEQRIPIRLLELVHRYPYTTNHSPTTDVRLLSRPQFTTQVYDALFVRVETELPTEIDRPKSKLQPLRIVAEALSCTAEEGDHAALWSKIVVASKAEGSGSPLTRIFTDDTIRILTLAGDEAAEDKAKQSPAHSLLALPSSGGRRPSFSLSEFTTDGNRTTAAQSAATETSPLTADWSVFSSAGFSSSSTPLTPLANTLFNTDDALKSSTSGKPSSPNGSRVELRKEPSGSSLKDELKLESKIAGIQIVQLDEAFVDFWSDALLDPVSASWPSFVVCKLRPALTSQLPYGEEGDKNLKWLVLEQAFAVKPPPPPPIPEATTLAERSSSPAPSSITKKRFAFWSSRSNSLLSTKSRKEGKDKNFGGPVGEMGEVLEEGSQGQPLSRASTSNTARGKKRESFIKVRVPSPKPRKSADTAPKSVDTTPPTDADKKDDNKEDKVAAVTAAAAVAGAGAVAVATQREGEAKEDAIVSNVELKEEPLPVPTEAQVTTADVLGAQAGAPATQHEPEATHASKVVEETIIKEAEPSEPVAIDEAKDDAPADNTPDAEVPVPGPAVEEIELRAPVSTEDQPAEPEPVPTREEETPAVATTSAPEDPATLNTPAEESAVAEPTPVVQVETAAPVTQDNVEIVHEIIEVDKVVTPPEIIEAVQASAVNSPKSETLDLAPANHQEGADSTPLPELAPEPVSEEQEEPTAADAIANADRAEEHTPAGTTDQETEQRGVEDVSDTSAIAEK